MIIRELVIELLKLDPECEITVEDEGEPDIVYSIFGVNTTMLLDGKPACSILPNYESPLTIEFEDEEDEK